MVLETNENESKGIYWFRELPKATIKSSFRKEQNEGFKVLKRIHRFSAMIESKVGDAVAIIPRAPEWRVMYEDKDTGFKMCKSSSIFLAKVNFFLYRLVFFFLQGNSGAEETRMLGELELWMYNICMQKKLPEHSGIQIQT